MKLELHLSVGERLQDPEEMQRRAIENKTDNLRCCTVGKIIDFNEQKQTATVQPLIKEYVKGEWLSLPKLLDVPCFFPRAGGYCLTFPVKPGDEVLVVFNDNCLDAWWQSGNEQTQLEIRRHDLSDAMCLFGITSVPKAVTEYSTNSLMLRNEDKDSYLEIVDDDKTINIYGAQKLNVTMVDDVTTKTQAQFIVEASGDIDLETASNLNARVSGNTYLTTSGNINIVSDGTVTITAEKINLNS